MNAYLKVFQRIAKEFISFEQTKIPRDGSWRTSRISFDIRSTTTMHYTCQKHSSAEYLSSQRILPYKRTKNRPKWWRRVGELMDEDASLASDKDEDWRTEIKLYIYDGEVPKDKWATRWLKSRSAHYIMLDGELFRWNASKELMHCVHGDKVRNFLIESHDGTGGNHSGGRSLALKIKKLDFLWPTMISDCEKYAAKCDACQCHSLMMHGLTEIFSSARTAYPFMRWAMVIVGHLPASYRRSTFWLW